MTPDPTLVLLVAGTLYGPVLVTIAVVVYALSLGPARPRASWLERAARRPLFWLWMPWLLALVVIARIATVEAPAAAVGSLPPGPTVTLTKTTTTHFNATGAVLSSYVDSSSDQLTILATRPPSTSLTIGPIMPFVIGDGAHAIEAPTGEFLIALGQAQTASVVLSSISATALTGPTFATPIGKGAFSFARGDGTFLLVAGGDTDVGGQPLRTYVVTPASVVGGTWTATAGPNLSGTNGAGLGAHAIKLTVLGITKFLIVHGGGGNTGTADTSLYTPPQPGATESMIAGPAFVSNKKAGQGALAIPRSDVTTFLVVLGGGNNDTQVYTPPTTLAGLGSLAVGPALSGGASDGTLAIQYKNAAVLDRFAIIRGGSKVADVYDPAAAAGAGVLGSLSVPNIPPGNPSIGAGAFGFLRADGTVGGFFGGTNTLAWVFDPLASSGGSDLANNGAFTALNVTNSLPMDRGSFALQQRNGLYLFFGGSTVESRFNDAGWALSATYESEPLNPGTVDRWTQISYTRNATDLTLQWRTSSAKDLLQNASYTTVNTSGGTSGTLALSPAPPVGDKWIQVKASLSRPAQASTGAEVSVWLGSSSVVQRRSIGGSAPVLLDYALTYQAGVIVLSAQSPETAGVGFPLTIEMRDTANNRILDYSGDHTLVFGGAATAPDASRPTVRDRGGNDVAFGQPTPLTFDASGVTAGTATRRATLYKREEIDVSVTETITAPGSSVAFSLSSHTLGTVAGATPTVAHVLVNAAGPSGTRSTLAASPRNVAPDGLALSTLTATLTDPFGNALPGLSVTLASDRGAADTFSAPTMPPSDFNGASTTTVKSSTRGLANITGTIVSAPSDLPMAKRYFGTTAAAFRAGPGGSNLLGAPTIVPGSPLTTSLLDFANGTGSRQVKPATTNATAASAGSSATNVGWRDESYSRTGQDTASSRLGGSWAFTYSLALSSGSAPITGQMTVVAYAVSTGNATREVFRHTSADLVVGVAELTYTDYFTPNYAVRNGVAGGLDAGEILQYELFLGLSANTNSSAVVQFRAGAAAAGIAAPTIEGAAISAAPSTTLSTAISPATQVNFNAGAAKITLTKNTSAHFVAGTAGAGVVTTSNRIALLGTIAGSATSATGPLANVGDGGHTLQGNGGEFLIVHGGGATGSTVYSPSGTVASGPSFGGAVGSGAFSLPRGDGTYLLVAGGGAVTFVVTPAGDVGGAWSVAAGPSLTGNAGVGAHAMKLSVLGTTKYLIVHGGGSAKTTLYAPSGNSVVAGPELVDPTTGLPGAAGVAGSGAHAIPRTDGKFLVVLGGGGIGSDVYTPPTALSGSGSAVIGSFTNGPSLTTAVGDGGHALQYTDGTGQARFLIVAGNASTATRVYDPGAAVTAGISNCPCPATPVNVGLGAHSLLRADGTYLLLEGGTNSAVFTPSTASFGAGITGLQTLGAGGHSFHRSEGRYAIVAGGASATLVLYDAGWVLAGTFTTEPLNPVNPGNVDKWDSASWTKSTEGSVTVSARTGTTSGSGTYVTIATASTGTSGFSAINGASGNRWVQAQLDLARTVPQSADAEQGVWLGSSSVAQSRALGPFLTQLVFGYTSGAFVVTASASQAAGADNVATLTLKDGAGNPVTDYGGLQSHSLTFAGAAAAPDGSQPQARDRGACPPAAAGNAANVSFGGSTPVTFASGAACAALVLKKAETAVISVTESVGATDSGTYLLSAYDIGTTGFPSIAVTAGAPSAAPGTSTVTATPTSAPADNATTVQIAVLVKDQFQNPVPSATVTLATDRASFDTLVQPGSTNAAGLASGTVRSQRSGTSTITVTAGGVPLPSATVTFSGSVFVVTTQHGGTETAGVAFTLTLTAQDANGQVVMSYSGIKRIVFTATAQARTSPVAGPSPIVTSPQTITFTNGVATTSTGTGSACGQPGTTPCAFTLYNTAQRPTITALDGAFPAGTTAPLTIVPATPSLTVSTVSADPLTVTPDNKDTANITVRVMDAFGNPVSGRAVTLRSSRTTSNDNLFQPPPTDADGIAVGQMTTQTTGTPTVTATVVGVGDIVQTVTINFVTPGGATRVLVIRTQNVEQEVAGVAFSITVTGIKSDGSIDQSFCGASSCSITVSNSGQAAPDGTQSTLPVTKSAPNFQNGTYTTNFPDGTLVTLYRANQVPPPIVTVTVTSPNASIIGVTPPIIVLPNAVNLSTVTVTKSYVFTVTELAPANGTPVQIGAKVVDFWKNPISGRTVTFASSRGAKDTITQPSGPTGALGLAFGTISSTTPSLGISPPPTLSVLTGTVATIPGVLGAGGAIVNPAPPNDPKVEFFGTAGSGKIQNGTRLGSVQSGTATDVSLRIVARDLAGAELDPSTPVAWTATGAGAGVFTLTTTTSGASTSAHSTFFQATRAGSVTIRGAYTISPGSLGAGAVVLLEIPVVIVSQFDVTSSTASGRTVLSRVEWDGTTLRVLSWVTVSP